tara:strand:+ start:26632 stop:28323 length:1692 start_codon:yes stop_codon:yes gene_type:complete
MHLLSLLKEMSLQPKNAEDLRTLILELAIQGKLTAKWREKNLDVESSSVLLQNIEVEKKELYKQKLIRKPKTLDEVREDEKYFNIPTSWFWERLGTIGNIFNGNSVNKNVKDTKYKGLDSGYPYIATKDVGYGFEPINHDNGVRIPYDEPKFKVARKKTVLICSEGGSAGKKMGILEEDCCFGNKLYAIEQFGEIESTYILALYGSLSFSKAFSEKMTGIIGGISRNNFADLLIPLPPLEEQKAIVETVNQLFQEVEQLEELTKERVSLKEDFVTSALRRLTESDNTNKEWNWLKDQFPMFFTEPSGVKKLRETILQLAVQGKLTAKWRVNNPDVQPASELLERIEKEKQQLIAEKNIKKEKPLPLIEEDEVPYELPDGWVWCRLGSIISLKSGQDLKSSQYSDKESFGIPYITGASNLLNEKVIINRWTNAPRSLAKRGDLLITCKGSGVGKMGWLHVESAHIARQIMAIDTIGSSIDFIKIIMDVNAMKFRKNAVGLIPGLDRATVLNTLVGFPSKVEQKAIVEKVNSLMALCDELEEQIETSQTQIEQLMQSCLKEVFEN